MLQSALVLAVLTGVGHALGWRAHGGLTGFWAAVGLLLLFRFAMLWIGIHLALIAGRPEMVQAVQILVWPVGFLSNALATPDSMPGWLGTVVQWNPLSRTATAVRELLAGGAVDSGHVWAAVGWPLGLLAVFFPLAVRRFARLSK
jgi:ABC-2 type transport system permease protein